MLKAGSRGQGGDMNSGNKGGPAPGAVSGFGGGGGGAEDNGASGRNGGYSGGGNGTHAKQSGGGNSNDDGVVQIFEFMSWFRKFF